MGCLERPRVAAENSWLRWAVDELHDARAASSPSEINAETVAFTLTASEFAELVQDARIAATRN
jgi:hypothetical protein